jgi:transposase
MATDCASAARSRVRRDLAMGLSPELREVLEPLLREVESLNERIREYDQRIEEMTKEAYPEVKLLKQVAQAGEGCRRPDCADLCPNH